MKLLDDNTLYEFTVEQGVGAGDFDSADYDPRPADFRVKIRYRKFEAPIRRAVAVAEQSLDLSADDGVRESMCRILFQFEVPSRIGEQMAEHFGFVTERIARRSALGGGGKIPISVRLDVKGLSPETVTGIRSRMESARTAGTPPRRRREAEEEGSVPARRSAIEALEKVRIDGGERECAICLEELSVGAEAARMPCGHVYHCGCIVEWLHRTHFCPFCRFHMPC